MVCLRTMRGERDVIDGSFVGRLWMISVGSLEGR